MLKCKLSQVKFYEFINEGIYVSDNLENLKEYFKTTLDSGVLEYFLDDIDKGNYRIVDSNTIFKTETDEDCKLIDLLFVDKDGYVTISEIISAYL